MVLTSPLPDVVIPKVDFSQYALNLMKKYGDETALIDEGDGGKAYSYTQILNNVLKCASALNRLDISKGDVVATCCGNCAAYPVVLMGSASCGAILSTCNPIYTKDEILKQFLQSEPKVVFVNDDNHATMKKVAEVAKSIKFIISMDSNQYGMSFDEFLANGNVREFPRNVKISPDDILLLPYSSGTTGLPKGVMLTHGNVVAGMTISRAFVRVSRYDVIYMVLPMFHIYGAISVIYCLMQGVKIIIEPRFDMVSMLQKIQKYKVTSFTAVPPILVAMDKMPLAEHFDLSSLTEVGSGAAPLPDGIAESIAKKYNFAVGQGWGLTEAVPATSTYTAKCPSKTVGVVVPNTLLKVVDTQTGKELGANKDGELCLKGPQVMKGYYKNPKATANCVDREGWFHTGDVGHYDEKGFVFVIDRIKELIKYKGFQVAPAELEELLLRHPMVGDVGVIGVPDAEAGEVPKAYVVKKDEGLTTDAIHEFIKDKVSKFKYIRGGITFIDAIPKTASGKILRRDLRELDKESRKTSSKM